MNSEIEIIVMPEKFQGMALTMTPPPLPGAPGASVAPKPSPPPPPAGGPPSAPARIPETHHAAWPLILVIIAFFLAVGGIFVFLNREILFKKAPPVSPSPLPVVIAAPEAPASLTATTSGLAVSLSWIDTATNETGYRLERREGDGTFIPLNSLSANSTAFLDVSVQAGGTYTYRVSAVNEGGTSSPSSEATITLPPPAPVAPPVPELPPAGLDSDSDGTTDVEETLTYQTDPHNPDTDGDGFLDGNEVFHLYNPAARAPVRLLDSGLVKVLSAPAGWSLYEPVNWKGVLDAADGSRATIPTGTGESFLISIEDNPDNETVLHWYLKQRPGAVSSSVRSFTTKGGLEGIFGVDRLDAYIAWHGKIFVIRYDLDGQRYINYRTTFEMMLNSLKLVGAPVLVSASPSALSGPGSLVGEKTTSSQP